LIAGINHMYVVKGWCMKYINKKSNIWKKNI